MAGNAENDGSGTWIEDQNHRSTMRVRECRLEVLDGPDAGRSETFASPTITLGRSGGHLVLDDKKVSALHAEIRLEDAGYLLRDLGSSNGTFVWGMRLVEGYLSPGAVIALGDSAVRFEPLATSVEVPLYQGTQFESLVGASPEMRRLFAQIEKVARTDMSVLISGETGTGKELVADAIYRRSARRDGPFVVLDCGAAPNQLFEDQLFGHEVGAFTGASRPQAGVFEQADGGTLFIDELGELPLELQSKLLRAVESRRVRRLAGSSEIECDVRIIAATNRDLRSEVNRKAFRSDLYFRLAVSELRVPPLRERREDVPMLVEHLLSQLGESRRSELPDGFLDWATRHGWPGNVRELRNAIERAALLDRLPDQAPKTVTTQPPVDLSVPFKQSKAQLIDEFERSYVSALLRAHDWNIAGAARAAGLDRMSVYKMLQRLGIERDQE
ncbi:MAG: sigma 54-interacting transcriptional regulator [Myxococcota bacterium]